MKPPLRVFPKHRPVCRDRYQHRREELKEALRNEGRKEVRFCGMTAADRVRNGEAYGSLPPPPHVFQEIHTETSRRERWRRRPSLKGPQCGSRGEASQGTASSLLEPFRRRL